MKHNYNKYKRGKDNDTRFINYHNNRVRGFNKKFRGGR